MTGVTGPEEKVTAILRGAPDMGYHGSRDWRALSIHPPSLWLGQVGVKVSVAQA